MPVRGEFLFALVTQTRDEIVHVRLMFKNHQCDDVAAFLRVTRHVKETSKIGEVAEIIERLLLCNEGGIANQIPTMNLVAMISCDIPTAPALFNRCAMIYL